MNNLLEYKDYLGTVEYSASDKLLYGQVLGINGLVSYEGKSIESLQSDFEEAVDDYLDMCREQGVEPQKTYKGTFNVRISPILHKNLHLYHIHHTTLYFIIKSAVCQ